jgi:hypothetical protein
MSIIRRTGARLLKLFRNEVGDPDVDSARVQIYAKDDGGIGQLFAMDTDGVVHQLTPAGGGTDLSGQVYFSPAGSPANTQLAKSDGSLYSRIITFAEDFAPGAYVATIDQNPPPGYGWVLIVPYVRSFAGNSVVTADVSAVGDTAFTVNIWNAAGDDVVAPAWLVAHLLLFPVGT